MPRTGPRSTPRSQMVGALPTFIALVLGSACLVAGGMGGLAVSEGCACPGRIWCRCRSECVRSQACIIRPAGLICKAMGGQIGQTCWEHFAITRIVQMFRRGLSGLSNFTSPLVRTGLESEPLIDLRPHWQLLGSNPRLETTEKNIHPPSCRRHVILNPLVKRRGRALVVVLGWAGGPGAWPGAR